MPTLLFLAALQELRWDLEDLYYDLRDYIHDRGRDLREVLAAIAMPALIGFLYRKLMPPEQAIIGADANVRP